jgi:alpha-L-fucosidase
MRWWHEARFGMFVHWGLYSQLKRHEWVMNRERIPVKEYEKLAATWKPKPRPARQWARLASKAGMKYMVMTAKHHEGFCLWDTKQTDYNAVKRGPGRDLVREYVEACREFGLRVGFYYSLMDWHHPDGARCARNEKARRRFVAFTRECVRELCSDYGKIDILWYDVAWPLHTPQLWESAKMNAMVRRLQPDIIVNNRSLLAGDFSTPEEHIRPAEEGRAWESCMTFNKSWGYQPAPPEDWHSVRDVLGMLRQATAGGGNLLLNIGPTADGSVPPEAVERLVPVGKWLARNGEAVYGKADRATGRTEGMPTGSWTLKGRTAYFWCTRWPGTDLAIGGIRSTVERASLLATGKPVAFEQTRDRLVLKGLPRRCPDRTAGVCVVKLECRSKLRQVLGFGVVVL